MSNGKARLAAECLDGMQRGAGLAALPILRSTTINKSLAPGSNRQLQLHGKPETALRQLLWSSQRTQVNMYHLMLCRI